MTELTQEPIRYAVFVHAAPEACWDALATARGLDGWFTTGAQADPRPGGFIHMRWEKWGPGEITYDERCPVLDARRGEVLVFQWRPDGPEYATTVSIEFETKGEGTVVRLEESGYHNTPSRRTAMLDCAAGWGEALALMKVYLEYGISTKR